MNLYLKEKFKDADFNALCALIITGVIVSVAWWLNATLVYDDIAFPSYFSALVDKIGWFNALVKIFVLDLPNEYRTYGISRVIQFLLWSISADSAHIYSVLISLSQLITALALYALLILLKIERIVALSTGLMWLLSPFVWTSCFHHYSYLILPYQLVIVGAYLLVRNSVGPYNKLLIILLGVALALTGELHLLPACFILIAVTLASGSKAALRASFLTIFTMFMAVAAHHFIWKIFAADPIQRQRFTLSVVHDTDFWVHRIFVAIRGIGRAFFEQLTEIAGHNLMALIFITVASGLLVFLSLSWMSHISKKNIHNEGGLVRSLMSVSVIFFISSCIYLFMFVAVVVLSDSVPQTMPRRYGYIPLTTMLIALFFAFAALIPGRYSKNIVLSLAIGALITLFMRHQGVTIPATNAADRRLSNMIGDAIKQNPDKVVLFFSASEDVFPRVSIDGATPGPAMRDVTSAEVTQAKYGTYWPAYINITKILNAPYACELGGIQVGGKLTLICPPWLDNPGVIDPSKVIVVANLGFNKYDPFGKRVEVFKNYRDFEPYFFSKRIIRNINWTEGSKNDVVAINLGDISKKASSNDVFQDKTFNDPLTKSENNWLINYGWIAGEDQVYKLPVVSINSEYYRTNRNGNFEYGFVFLESDIDIYLDFWELWGGVGRRLFDIEVSWNGGPWIVLGTIDPALINGDKPFSIHMAHQNTRSFYFRLSSKPGADDVPFIQGVRIARRPS